jgi:agmatinase
VSAELSSVRGVIIRPMPTKTKTPPGFGGLPAEFRNPKTAQIVVLPVPYDKTSTWQKGADKGPAALIAASANMELYDIATRSEVYCRGIATLPPIKYAGSPDTLAIKVQKAMTKIWDDGRFPVLLGGEHSVSIGAFRAAAAKFSNLSILQIDAHGDTRESYHGSKCNHACVMARARELCPITQVGIRAIDIEEVAGMDERRVFWGHEIAGSADPAGWIGRVVDQQSENVYVTIDLDAFDPAYCPATGTPEPGGLSWQEVNRLLEELVAERNVIGFDVVELLPKRELWASDFLAAKLVYRFLSMIFARRA